MSCLCGRDEWCNQCSQLVNKCECEKLKSEVERLHRVIAKELTENDELGCEYTYVNALRRELKDVLAQLKVWDGRPSLSRNPITKSDLRRLMSIMQETL